MKTRSKYIFALWTLECLLVTVAVPRSSYAQTDKSPAPISWKIYNDPKYDFTVEYPANWVVIPRVDKEGEFGSVLTFSTIDPSTVVHQLGDDLDKPLGTQVVIGLRLTERNSTESLTDWSVNNHNALVVHDSAKIGVKNLSATALSLSPNAEAVIFQGLLDGLPVQYADIANGNAVWFVWTNSLADGNPTVYSHMLATFRLGAQTPKSLKEAYGIAYTNAVTKSVSRKGQGLAHPANSRNYWGTNWAIPWSTYQWQAISTGPGCSTLHQGQSYEAIDYVLDTGTLIHATEEGNVVIAGWDNTGYGNLVKLDHSNNYFSLYAHLNSIAVVVGNHLNQWSGLGYSGSTGGTSTGPHLHFEVRSGSYSIWIRTLATTSWASGDPNNPCQPPGVNDGSAYH